MCATLDRCEGVIKDLPEAREDPCFPVTPPSGSDPSDLESCRLLVISLWSLDPEEACESTGERSILFNGS